MTINDAFDCFGKYVQFKVKDTNYLGQLVKISLRDDGAVELTFDMDDTLESFPIEDVQDERAETSLFTGIEPVIKEITDKIDSYSLRLNKYHEEDCERILSKIKDKHQTAVYMIRACLSPGVTRKMYAPAVQALEETDLEAEDKNLIRGIIAYMCGEYNDAFTIFGRAWFQAPNDPERCMDLYLTAEAAKNQVLCFYLLKQIFRNRRFWSNSSIPIDMLWFRFTFYCTKYGDFTCFTELDDTAWYKTGDLIQSYIYIFYAYNMKQLCVNLIPLLASKEDVSAKLRLYKSYLPERSESYYKRAEFCIQRILADPMPVDPFSAPRISGLIYEYISAKKDGYILGWDLMNYKYRASDLPPELLEQAIDNIASRIEVRESDLIRVSFAKSSSGEKRNAGDICNDGTDVL
ncbi:MAG: hypothetical protein K5695_10715 [Oscillospiraceae bacterium]|nr:hypothetical protein [Oscillospiraceae bacterium]